jgi:hypothetical protein
VAIGELGPVAKYLNSDGLLALLKERDKAQAEILDKIGLLRDLGFADRRCRAGLGWRASDRGQMNKPG